VSVSAAFEAVGRFTKSDTRERLRGLLIERERRDGLALTSREIEDEIAAEAEGEGVPVEPEAGSAEAIRRHAQRTIAQLEAKRSGLAPEALTDLDARAQVESIDGEIREARLSAELADLAETETARRAREQAEQAAQAGREEADRQAAEMVPKVAKLKADADEAAISWVQRVVALRDGMETHTGFVGAATNGDKMAMRSVEYRDGDVLAALRSATRGRIHIDSLGAGPRDALLVPPSESGE
jgi:hypothetical protein